ncbi:MAG: hypothetical protein JKY00_12640 [Roseicyclus sp.]|nr:hypothetical protein [Roseicyclus sp.]
MATPLAAQTLLTERPGRWIAVTRSQTLTPDQTLAPVLEAPASGPMITSEPTPAIELTAPEAVTLVAPPQVVPNAHPNTRPIPRPRALQVVEAPDIALEVVEIALQVPEVLPAPAPAPALEPVPVPEPAQEVVIEAPVEVTAVPDTRPVPRQQTSEVAALAEALAVQIAADARTIVAPAPGVLPRADDGMPTDVAATDLASAGTEPGNALRETAARASGPSLPEPATVAPVPRVVAALAPAPVSVQPTAMSAVLLPASLNTTRPLVQPVAFSAPPLEDTPILPRLRPSGPVVQDGIALLGAAHPATLSAVLVPRAAPQPTQGPRLIRAAAPALDPFPLSALPPSSLPGGPDSLDRTSQPPQPLAEAHAAVWIIGSGTAPARVLPPVAPTLPAPEAAPIDPDAPIQLPAPDSAALARMIDDALICWRFADLPPEAQSARISVDVALDQTNMPSAPSIRLTGFAQVVSSAAEDAYRAAHAALVGCAEASANAPATTPATLLFDRNGVRLQ